MGGRPRLGSRSQIAIAGALILLPAGVLAYLGYGAVAARDETLRINYAATSALIRDRLVAELNVSESRLSPPLNPIHQRQRAALQTWLRDLPRTHTWLSGPFLISGDDGILLPDVWSRWPGEPVPAGRSGPLADAIRRSEQLEFVRADLPGALQSYRESLALAPTPSDRAFVQTRIGRTLFKLQRTEEGLTAYQSAADLAAANDALGEIPIVVAAYAQVVDALEATGRTRDRDAATVERLQWVVDHPWDANRGYAFHLDAARRAATTASAPLIARAAEVTSALDELEWIRENIAASRVSLPANTSAGRAHVVAPRGAGSILLGLQRLPRPSGDPDLLVGYEIHRDRVSSALLQHVLRDVDLGRQVSVVVEDGTVDASAPRLASAALSAFGPGWRVALRHTDGRTLDEITSRERLGYGAFVAAALTVLGGGVLFTWRAWRREAELGRLRTEFVANVSHELKTPLALIRMFSETLESGVVNDPERRREFHGIIRRESERLTHLIDNVLDAARIDAGTRQLTRERIDLVSVVREVIDAYGPLFTRLGFAVHVSLPDTPVLAEVDRAATAQALVNLLQNAIKYSPAEKDVAVSVAADEREVRLSVRDRGVGIRKDEIPRIFDEYYRAGADAPTPRPAGSGLGLAIVRHTMGAVGGRIDVDSAPGRGSTFTLVFPAATAVPPSAA